MDITDHSSDEALEDCEMDRLLEMRKKADADYRELEQQARDIEHKKALLRFHMNKLDEQLADSEKASLRPKRPGDPTSLPVLIEAALEQHREGLTITEILAALMNMGFETAAKKPKANVTTVLYRHRQTKFDHLEDGRWYLIRLGAPAPRLRVIQPNPNPHGEMRIKNGAPVPKGMR